MHPRGASFHSSNIILSSGGPRDVVPVIKVFRHAVVLSKIVLIRLGIEESVRQLRYIDRCSTDKRPSGDIEHEIVIVCTVNLECAI